MTTINVANEHIVTIAKINSLAVDTTRLNDDVLSFIFAYGLKQVLNDAGSSAKSADEKLAMATAKLANLYDGKLRKQRAAGASQTAFDKVLERVAGNMAKQLFGHVSAKGDWKRDATQIDNAKKFAAKHELDLSDGADFIDAAIDIIVSTSAKAREIADREYAAEIAKQAALADAVSDVL